MRKISGMTLTIKDILEVLRDEVVEFVDFIGDGEDESFNQVVDLFSAYEKKYMDEYESLSNLPVISEDDINANFATIKNYYPEYYKGHALYKYREIMESLVEMRCPICDCSFAYSQVTLDHIIPKKKYPYYSITPINLVPTCYNCNMRKNDGTPSKILHPYFHDFITFDYLTVTLEVNEKEPTESIINLGFTELNSDDVNEINKVESIKANIDLYKLRQKYTDIINISFSKLIDEFQKVVSIQNDVYSINELKKYFKLMDIFMDSNDYNYVDEDFLRHLCIVEITQNTHFLSCLAEKLNIFVDYDTQIVESMEKLNNKIKESPLYNQSNTLELIKETLPMIMFIGLYKFTDKSLNLINYRGVYQKEDSVFKFKPEEQYLNSILAHQVFSINESLLLSKVQPKGQAGTEIVIPTGNKNFCILLVNGLFNIKSQKLNELEILIKKLLVKTVN
ncbi:HNH endonuclease signature motif containing protein [Lactococcus lactis]|uniref:HNH endonuclease signature motif containing protein n=1 Tax=Lactococcus lactis TaxID=1358 RepID=UPI003F29C922